MAPTNTRPNEGAPVMNCRPRCWGIGENSILMCVSQSSCLFGPHEDLAKRGRPHHESSLPGLERWQE
jgi:hypothetical protein